MAWAVVQSPTVTTVDATGTSITKAFTSNVTAGNLIVVVAEWTNASAENCDCSDTIGTTYTRIATGVWDTTGQYGSQIFYGIAPSSAANTVTINNYGGTGASRTFRLLAVYEISGNAASSVMNQSKFVANLAGSNVTDAMTSGTAATSVDGCLIFGFQQACRSGAPGTMTAGTGYSTITQQTGYSYASEQKTQTTAGSVAATFTIANNANFWIVGMVAFAPAGAASPGGSMPSWIGYGAVEGSATTLTPTMPSGIAANDILLLVVEADRADTAPSLSTANGFAQFTDNGPQRSGAAGGSYQALFWKRAVGSDSAPVIADGGDHVTAVMCLIRGCKTTGNPWNTSSGSFRDSNASSFTVPGSTTSANNCLVVVMVTDPTDAASAKYSAWANSTLANITEQVDGGTTAGNGGGIAVTTGELAAAGTYDVTTGNMTVSNYNTYITVALEGAPPAGGSPRKKKSRIGCGSRGGALVDA